MSGRLDGTARTYSSGKSNTEPSSSSTFGSGAFLNASTTTISPLRPAPSTLALDARTRTARCRPRSENLKEPWFPVVSRVATPFTRVFTVVRAFIPASVAVVVVTPCAIVSSARVTRR